MTKLDLVALLVDAMEDSPGDVVPEEILATGPGVLESTHRWGAHVAEVTYERATTEESRSLAPAPA